MFSLFRYSCTNIARETPNTGKSSASVLLCVCNMCCNCVTHYMVKIFTNFVLRTSCLSNYNISLTNQWAEGNNWDSFLFVCFYLTTVWKKQLKTHLECKVKKRCFDYSKFLRKCQYFSSANVVESHLLVLKTNKKILCIKNFVKYSFFLLFIFLDLF